MGLPAHFAGFWLFVAGFVFFQAHPCLKAFLPCIKRSGRFHSRLFRDAGADAAGSKNTASQQKNESLSRGAHEAEQVSAASFLGRNMATPICQLLRKLKMDNNKLILTGPRPTQLCTLHIYTSFINVSQVFLPAFKFNDANTCVPALCAQFLRPKTADYVCNPAER
jgi:hypothetical protein